MKKRTDVIAAAALAFVANLPRKPAVATALDSTLPETAKTLNEVVPFESKVLMPKKMDKYLVSSILSRILKDNLPVSEWPTFLVRSEVDYILAVLDEVTVWATSQGYSVGV